jgi:hypothetical protein
MTSVQSSQETSEKVLAILDEEGSLAAADRLLDIFRERKQFAELFEVHKMRSRIAIGLSPVATPDDPALTEEQQDQLERAMLEACREVGTALLQLGRLEEGWMYMRPVGDRAASAAALSGVSVTDENLDALIHLYVHESVDVGRGTALSLEHRGVCNTITMMDSAVSQHGRTEQQAAVSVLVRHVHAEVLAAVHGDLQRRGLSGSDSETLAQALEQNPNLMTDGGYHMDTTHISSTVRFSRVLDEPATLRLGLDLAVYGTYLHSNYQYPGDEPFSDLHASTAAFLRTLLGEKVDQGLRLFRSRAEDLNVAEHGTVAIETYADLLARIGKNEEALKFLVRRMPVGERPCGIAPSLLELCSATGDFQPMIDQARDREDLVGFAAAVLQRASRQS